MSFCAPFPVLEVVRRRLVRRRLGSPSAAVPRARARFFDCAWGLQSRGVSEDGDLSVTFDLARFSTLVWVCSHVGPRTGPVPKSMFLGATLRHARMLSTRSLAAIPLRIHQISFEL